MIKLQKIKTNRRVFNQCFRQDFNTLPVLVGIGPLALTGSVAVYLGVCAFVSLAAAVDWIVASAT